MTESLRLLGGSAETLTDRLAGVSLLLLSVALALHVGKLVARARAWHNIARAAYPDEELRFAHTVGAYLSGIGLNAVLPGRPGEVLKLALFKRNAPGTRYRALASTLLTESAFDTVTAAAALGYGVFVGWTSISGPVLTLAAPLASHPWLAGGAVAIGVGVLLAGLRLFGGRLREAAAVAAGGFAIFRQPRRYVGSVLTWQVAALALRLGSIYCFLAAFHLPASPQMTFLVLAVQCAANLIPLTPNGAGTQQALLVLALGSGLTASSIVNFGAGAQLVTAVGEVTLALISLVLMTGSLQWRALFVADADATASS